MKVWLNDLKEGDIFYFIIRHNIYKCEHLGDAHNMNYKMSRIKYKILENNNLDYLGERETFVNQYVYDDYTSAIEGIIEIIKEDISYANNSIDKFRNEINYYELQLKNLKELLDKYNKIYKNTN